VKALVVAALGAALVAACGPSQDAGVVLWHSYTGAERTALEQTAARWNQSHADKPLTLVFVPDEVIGDKLSSAIPRGNGPDLFIRAHDRIGNWADAGVLEPIEFWVDDARADRFTDQALGAMAYGNSLYGLPVALKSLAMFYRTDLVAKPPTTTDELIAMKHGDDVVLAYANIDLYGHAAWLHGFGGRIMDDAGKLAIASPEAARAMEFARSLVEKRVIPADVQDPQVQAMFNDGTAPMVLQGPWFIPNIGSGVPWKVAPLPTISVTGKPAAPFLSVEGIMMSARARDKDAAFAVMDELTSDADAIVRGHLARQVVANRAAWDDPQIADDPVLAVFRAQLANTVAMPKAKGMRMVWTPYRTALGEVLSGRAEAGPQLLSVERQVQTYLERK
jgi:maltose-binding protein MalE